MRPLREDDLAAAQLLSSGMGWPHLVSDWAMLLALGDGVAAVNQSGSLIGTGMWWACDARHATLGMMLVAPAWQGQGIGRRLLGSLLARTAGRSLMLNATEVGQALYADMGFVATGEVEQYQGRFMAAPSPACQGSMLRVLHTDDVAQVAALDAAAFGAPRLPLLRRLLAEGQAWVLQ